VQDSTNNDESIKTWTGAEIASKCRLWARTRDPEVRFSEFGLQFLDSYPVEKILPSTWAEMIEGADQEAVAEIFHFLQGAEVLTCRMTSCVSIS
jgi:hypothetical protein